MGRSHSKTGNWRGRLSYQAIQRQGTGGTDKSFAKGRRQNKMQNLYQLDVYPKLLFEAVAA